MSTPDEPIRPDDTIAPGEPVRADDTVVPGSPGHADDTVVPAGPGDANHPAASGGPGGGDADELTPLKNFSHYTLLKEIGRGAQGVVFLAEDQKLHRKVALKMLAGAQSELTRDRFRREAETASRLDHPGICGVLEIGEEEGVPFIAMQYVRGIPLDEMISRSRRDRERDATIRDVSKSLTGEALASVVDEAAPAKKGVVAVSTRGEAQDVVRLIERAARALHVAHEAGLVHRDIKPGNLMITQDGHPVILDFGLARDLDAEGQTLTASGQLLGTPAYMSVEQIFGKRDEVDRRTDIYSLAATLYECLTLERPFEAATLEQLFQKIRSTTPTNPRKLNPRINQDLRTVIEVAMDADRNRRYTTALAFAEDLRRVRFLEPIQAKAAGPVTRSIKWARRNPGKGMAVVAATLFAVSALGFLVAQDLQRKSMVRENLDRAETLLAQADFTGAFAAVARARERDPDSVRAAVLGPEIEKAQQAADTAARRAADLAAAAEARASSKATQTEYVSLTGEIAALSGEIEELRPRVVDAYAPRSARVDFAARETALQEKRVAAEQLLADARNDLQRAAELEAAWGGNPETTAAFADFYMTLWREALKSDEPVKERSYRAAVGRYDDEGRYRNELMGRGTATVSVLPQDAETYLFRYEPYESVRPGGVIPRKVPVPTAGIGRVREGAWYEGFYPGDLCLEIADVVADSPASDVGLGEGDLVIALNGQPCGDGLFVTAVNGDLSGAGIRRLARIESLSGLPVESAFDWNMAPRPTGQELDHIQFANDADVYLDRSRIESASARDILAAAAPDDLELICLRRGEAVSLRVRAGEISGLRTRVTAYPLILAPENRIRVSVTLDMDPGSYLLLVRGPGHEPQRYPFTVARGGHVAPAVELLPAHTTPDGFVHVPPGPYLSGGDDEAPGTLPLQEKTTEGFFISRTEMTYGDWFEFVNDPEILAEIRTLQERGEGLRYVPRETSGPVARGPASPGGAWGWRKESGADTPLMAVSRFDIDAYLEWRNRKAEEDGFPWVFDLPTTEEWEKAARGTDGRFFPWGNRLDFSLTISRRRHRDWLLDLPGGFEPRDESPFGVLDMAGSRQEWLRDPVPGTDPAVYPVRGGSWSDTQAPIFRLATRLEAPPLTVGGRKGFRLVLRPRE